MKHPCNVICSAFVFFSTFALSSPILAASQTGIASVYSNEKTANGEYAHASALTAAHRTLPFGTLVEVTNIRNGRSVVVRINDRGPFVAGRVIDLTPAGAKAIGCSGLVPVRLTVVERGGERRSRQASHAGQQG